MARLPLQCRSPRQLLPLAVPPKTCLIRHDRAVVGYVCRTPPLPPVRTKKSKPPKITFPEDELLLAYYRKHPEVGRIKASGIVCVGSHAAAGPWLRA
jgi:hypothetical protein